MYVVMNSEQVRSLREQKGLSKRGLAAAASVSETTARRVEREVPVTFRTGRKMAKALGVEPYRWGLEDEVTVSAFGGFWHVWRSPESKGKVIRALALEDLQDLLRSQWSDVTHVAYHPSANAYLKGRDTILQTVIEGVTDQ